MGWDAGFSIKLAVAKGVSVSDLGFVGRYRPTTTPDDTHFQTADDMT